MDSLSEPEPAGNLYNPMLSLSLELVLEFVAEPAVVLLVWRWFAAALMASCKPRECLLECPKGLLDAEPVLRCPAPVFELMEEDLE